MRSVKHAKHAKRALHPTRTTLSTGLTALLLPLCMGAPALAQTATPSPTPTTTATVAPAPAKVATTLTTSGPTSQVWKGYHRIGVRLLADGRAVPNAYVRIERHTADGWVYLGRVLTNTYGNAAGSYYFGRSTYVRAVYAGSSTRTASRSSNRLVRLMHFRERAVRVAAAQKGDPYRYGATGPGSFDCSGLMLYAFKAAGKTLPRTSREQYGATQRLAKADKRRGDLIFIHYSGRITHVGLYAGDGKMWVAPKAGDVVKLQTIYTSSYYVGRVR